MSRRNGHIRNFGMAARLGSAALSGDLRAYPGGRQVIYLELNDAGALLRFTDMYSRVIGGQMWLAMDPPTADGMPQDGVINVRDFSIRGESELQRVAANGSSDRADQQIRRRRELLAHARRVHEARRASFRYAKAWFGARRSARRWRGSSTTHMTTCACAARSSRPIA